MPVPLFCLEDLVVPTRFRRRSLLSVLPGLFVLWCLALSIDARPGRPAPRVVAPRPVIGEAPVTFSNQVVRILQAHCQTCHRTGGIAPFPLVARVPDWDFHWQATYTYRTPLALPFGSQIELFARYDNSAANPENPNQPPRDVGWGENTTDEMCIAFLGVTLDEENLSTSSEDAPLLDWDGLWRSRGLGLR